MSKRVSLLLACVAALLAAPHPGLGADDTKSARIDNARIFPFFASGGGWESTIQLINVFESSINYRLLFRGINGQPALVSYRTQDGRIAAADTIQGSLGDDASATIVLIDAGLTQSGWVELEYEGESRIGGVLTFRQRVSGRPDFESSVELTRDDTQRLYMPFDNTAGYATSVAITNPSGSANNELQLRFWDNSGREILTRTVQLAAGTTTAFSLRERYPELDGRSGRMRIEGTGSRLAAIAFKFNPSGAFSAIPVLSR